MVVEVVKNKATNKIESTEIDRNFILRLKQIK